MMMKLRLMRQLNDEWNRGFELCTKAPLSYPLKRRLWSDVSQMLFAQEVEPTPLLWRSEGEGMALECNCYRLQTITFTSKQWLHKERTLSRCHCCQWAHQMISERPVPETAGRRVTAKSNVGFKESYERFTISWRVQPSPVSLSAWTSIFAPQAILRSQQARVYGISELCPWSACRNYTSVK